MRNNGTDSFMPSRGDDSFECLALMHLDGLTTAAQAAQLTKLLAQDPTAPARMTAIADRHAQLRELGKSHADQPTSTSEPTTRSITKNRVTTKRIPFPKRQKSPAPLRWVAAAALLFIAAGTVIILNAPPNAGDQLQITAGQLALTRNGQTEITNTPFTLLPGDQLTTDGASRATITTSDGSVIAISPHSNITWRTTTKPLRITTGSVLADITPQLPDHPFLAETQHALITVLGTKFTFTADEKVSVLHVDHGRVRLTNQHDKQEIEVAALQIAGTTGSSVLKTQPATNFTSDSYGLTGDYFNNANFTEWRFRRTDAQINFDWLQGSPDPQIDPQSFSVRWRGYLLPPNTSSYTLQVEVDDGVRLWIGDTLVIDQWILTSRATFTGTIHLEAGQNYPLRLDYFQEPVDTLVKLNWSTDGQNFQPIPASNLRPLTWTPK